MGRELGEAREALRRAEARLSPDGATLETVVYCPQSVARELWRRPVGHGQPLSAAPTEDGGYTIGSPELEALIKRLDQHDGSPPIGGLSPDPDIGGRLRPPDARRPARPVAAR